MNHENKPNITVYTFFKTHLFNSYKVKLGHLSDSRNTVNFSKYEHYYNNPSESFNEIYMARVEIFFLKGTNKQNFFEFNWKLQNKQGSIHIPINLGKPFIFLPDLLEDSFDNPNLTHHGKFIKPKIMDLEYLWYFYFKEDYLSLFRYANEKSYADSPILNSDYDPIMLTILVLNKINQLKFDQGREEKLIYGLAFIGTLRPSSSREISPIKLKPFDFQNYKSLIGTNFSLESLRGLNLFISDTYKDYVFQGLAFILCIYSKVTSQPFDKLLADFTLIKLKDKLYPYFINAHRKFNFEIEDCEISELIKGNNIEGLRLIISCIKRPDRFFKVFNIIMNPNPYPPDFKQIKEIFERFLQNISKSNDILQYPNIKDELGKLTNISQDVIKSLLKQLQSHSLRLIYEMKDSLNIADLISLIDNMKYTDEETIAVLTPHFNNLVEKYDIIQFYEELCSTRNLDFQSSLLLNYSRIFCDNYKSNPFKIIKFLENIELIPLKNIPDDIILTALKSLTLPKDVVLIINLYTEKLKNDSTKLSIQKFLSDYFGDNNLHLDLITFFYLFVGLSNLQNEDPLKILIQSVLEKLLSIQLSDSYLYKHLILNPDYEELWKLIDIIEKSQTRNIFFDRISQFCSSFEIKIQKEDLKNQDLSYINQTNIKNDSDRTKFYQNLKLFDKYLGGENSISNEFANLIESFLQAYEQYTILYKFLNFFKHTNIDISEITQLYGKLKTAYEESTFISFKMHSEIVEFLPLINKFLNLMKNESFKLYFSASQIVKKIEIKGIREFIEMSLLALRKELEKLFSDFDEYPIQDYKNKFPSMNYETIRELYSSLCEGNISEINKKLTQELNLKFEKVQQLKNISDYCDIFKKFLLEYRQENQKDGELQIVEKIAELKKAIENSKFLKDYVNSYNLGSKILDLGFTTNDILKKKSQVVKSIISILESMLDYNNTLDELNKYDDNKYKELEEIIMQSDDFVPPEIFPLCIEVKQFIKTYSKTYKSNMLEFIINLIKENASNEKNLDHTRFILEQTLQYSGQIILNLTSLSEDAKEIKDSFKNLIDNSMLCFKYSKKSKLFCFYLKVTIKKYDKEYNEDNLIKLKNSYMMKQTNQDSDSSIYKQYNSFVNYIKQMEEYKKILNKLLLKGLLDINQSNPIKFGNSEYILKEEQKFYNQNHNLWDKRLENNNLEEKMREESAFLIEESQENDEFRSSEFFLNFLSGNLFAFFLSHISGNCKKCKKQSIKDGHSKKLRNIFRFIDREFKSSEEFYGICPSLLYNEMFDNAKSFLKHEFADQSTPKGSKRKLNLNLNVNKIKNINDYPINIIYEKDPLSAILTIKVGTSIEFPKLFQVLFCTKLTRKDELIKFLNRCFLDDHRDSFFLINPENIPDYIHSYIVKYLIEYFRTKLNLLFKLFVILPPTEENEKYELINFLSRQSFAHETFNFEKIKNCVIKSEILKRFGIQYKLVISEKEGLGKTSFIMKSLENKCNSTKLNLFEEISQREIYTLLKSISYSEEKSALFIEIHQFTNPYSIKFIMGILSSIILFQGVYLCGRPLFLNKLKYLFIEIANNDLHLPIKQELCSNLCEIFNKDKLILNCINFSQFIPHNVIQSYICYEYQKLLNTGQMDAQTIIKSNDINKKFKENNKIEYCNGLKNILIKCEKLDKISWIELNIFERMLSKQFYEFHLSPYSYSIIEKIFEKNEGSSPNPQIQVRSKIAKLLYKLPLYAINQSKYLLNKFDQAHDIDSYFSELIHNIVGWDKIDFAAIAFSENLLAVPIYKSVSLFEEKGPLNFFEQYLNNFLKNIFKSFRGILFEMCLNIRMVFLIDTTSSMKPFIDQMKLTIKKTIKLISKSFKYSNVKMGIIAYKDHMDSDYVTLILPMKDYKKEKDSIIKWINNLTEQGGGDSPEAVADALYKAINDINWGNNTLKFIIHITDAPGHGKEFSDEDDGKTELHLRCKYCSSISKLDEILENIKRKDIFYLIIKLTSFVEKMIKYFQAKGINLTSLDLEEYARKQVISDDKNKKKNSKKDIRNEEENYSKAAEEMSRKMPELIHLKFEEIEKMKSKDIFEKLLMLTLKTQEQKNKLRKKTDYVLTSDGFLKMVMINERIKSNLPIILIGESGCGKTKLITHLCKNILDNELIIVRVNAGYTSAHLAECLKEIIEKANKNPNLQFWAFFDEFNTTKAIPLFKELFCDFFFNGKKLPANLRLLGACNPFRFKIQTKEFEEDNTIGLKLALKTNTKINFRLQYVVEPIPPSILRYAWNFGALSDEDLSKYIYKMLRNKLYPNKNIVCQIIVSIHKFFREDKKDISTSSLRDVARIEKLFQFFLKFLPFQTEKVKNSKEDLDKTMKTENVCANNQTSNNSQIELEKLQTLYFDNSKENVIQDTSIKVGNGIKNENEPENNLKLYSKHALILSLLMCYYFRVNSWQDRQSILQKIATPLDLDIAAIKTILDFSTKFLTSKLTFEKGIILNESLSEICFALFVCIINRLPIIICGKPGTSKSLSMRAVMNYLKSKNDILKRFTGFDGVSTIYYQGSMTSNSEGLIEVFSKAKNFKSKHNSLCQILPVIFFDEIGLSELSPHNPLKVIHEELEIEKQDDYFYSFVGISNWFLDSSKMNRVITVSIVDPHDKIEAGSNATDLAAYYFKEYVYLSNFIYEITNLGELYFQFKFKKYINDKEKQKYIEIYGLRDYYYFIKAVCTSTIKGYHISAHPEDESILNHESLFYKNVFRSFQLNFDRLSRVFNPIEYFWDDISIRYLGNNIIQSDLSILDIITNNLDNSDSRYLMFIGSSSIPQIIVQNTLLSMSESIFNRSVSMVGSLFKEDLEDEYYEFETVKRIINHCEDDRETILLLSDLDIVYPSLYDLFNKSFSKFPSNNKFYCQISLGSLSLLCRIHKNFSCIVFINEDRLTNFDPPFLNRFEKHFIELLPHIKDFLYEISHYKNLMIKQILEKTLSIIILDYDPDEIKEYLNKIKSNQHLFISSYNEYLLEIIAYKFATANKNEGIEKIKEGIKLEIIKQIIQTATLDYYILLKFVSLNEHESEISKAITEFEEVHKHSFIDYAINHVIKNNNSLNNSIIYTYDNSNEINIDILNSLNAFKPIYISTIQRESSLREEVSHFYKDNRFQSLFVVLNLFKEDQHFTLLKFIIEEHFAIYKKQINAKEVNRKFVFVIVKMKRKFNKEHKIGLSTMGNWNQIFFEDLTDSSEKPIQMISYMLNPSQKLLNNDYFDNFVQPNIIPKYLQNAISLLHFELDLSFEIDNYFQYTNEILNLNNNFGAFLISEVKKIVQLSTDVRESNIIMRKLFFQIKFENTNSTVEAIEKIHSDIIEKYILDFVYNLQKVSSLFALNILINSLANNDIIKKFTSLVHNYIDGFPSFINKLDYVLSFDDKLLDLSIPFSFVDYITFEQLKKLNQQITLDKSFYKNEFYIILNSKELQLNYLKDFSLIITSKNFLNKRVAQIFERYFKQQFDRNMTVEAIISEYFSNQIRIISFMNVFSILIDYLEPNDESVYLIAMEALKAQSSNEFKSIFLFELFRKELFYPNLNEKEPEESIIILKKHLSMIKKLMLSFPRIKGKITVLEFSALKAVISYESFFLVNQKLVSDPRSIIRSFFQNGKFEFRSFEEALKKEYDKIIQQDSSFQSLKEAIFIFGILSFISDIILSGQDDKNELGKQNRAKYLIDNLNQSLIKNEHIQTSLNKLFEDILYSIDLFKINTDSIKKDKSNDFIFINSNFAISKIEETYMRNEVALNIESQPINGTLASLLSKFVYEYLEKKNLNIDQKEESYLLIATCIQLRIKDIENNYSGHNQCLQYIVNFAIIKFLFQKSLDFVCPFCKDLNTQKNSSNQVLETLSNSEFKITKFLSLNYLEILCNRLIVTTIKQGKSFISSKNAQTLLSKYKLFKELKDFVSSASIHNSTIEEIINIQEKKLGISNNGFSNIYGNQKIGIDTYLKKIKMLTKSFNWPYLYTKIYIENYDSFNEIIELRIIIRFYKQMFNKINMKFSKSKFKHTTIKDLLDDQNDGPGNLVDSKYFLDQSFDEFQKSIIRLSTKNNKFMNLLGYEDSYYALHLEKIMVTDEMILLQENNFYNSYILPLVKEHNEIVGKINGELTKIGINLLGEGNLFDFSEKNFHHVNIDIMPFSCLNIKSKEIMFNFELLEINLEEALNGLKFIINPEILKLRFIDDDNPSGVIDLIKKKNFNKLKYEENKYKELLKELVISISTKNDTKFFKDNFDQLVIEALRRPNIQSNSKLCDLIQNSKYKQHFEHLIERMAIPMSHLLQFYEEIEVLLFNKIYEKEIEMIRDRERSNPELVKLRTFLQSNIDASNTEIVNDLAKALIKCAIRFYLSGRDENLHMKLDDFLFHSQLYETPLKMDQVMKFLDKNTKNLHLFDVFIVYSYLSCKQKNPDKGLPDPDNSGKDHRENHSGHNDENGDGNYYYG